MKHLLRITAEQRDTLKALLYPGDGNETVAFVLCGHSGGEDREVYTVRAVLPVDQDAYIERRRDVVRWQTYVLPPILDRLSTEPLWLLKAHSHPSGWREFSVQDDQSDHTLAEAVVAWLGPRAGMVLSALMLPDGTLHARTVDDAGNFAPVDAVDVIGHDLHFERAIKREAEAFGAAVTQAFGAGTFALLRQLKVAVVGCSGTGSIVIEQLARSGIGTLVLVDPDVVEERNLNRIVNATSVDAEEHTSKVDVMRRAIAAMGTGTRVKAIAKNLFTPEAVRAVSSADIIFGCVDSVDARHLLCHLGSFYLLPYFDLGVKLEADGRGGIDQVCGSVHYLQPGGGSLLSRGVYTLEDVRAAGLFRRDPQHYADQLKRGYIRGVLEQRPAVISVNMLVASLGVNDLLARLHPYRIEGNDSYAIQQLSLSHDIFEHTSDPEHCPVVGRNLGRGDIEPLLNQPELSE